MYYFNNQLHRFELTYEYFEDHVKTDIIETENKMDDCTRISLALYSSRVGIRFRKLALFV